MIVIDKPRLKFLLAGRQVEVVIPRKREDGTERKTVWHKSRVYAIGLTSKRTTCHATVLKVVEDEKTITLTLQHAPLGADRDRWMGRGGGYTTNRAAALLQEDEPAVDEETQRRITEMGTLRWQQEREFRQARQEALSLRERVGQLELLAQQGDDQAKRALHSIRQRLERIERQRAA